jgi:hypothetical protein
VSVANDFWLDQNISFTQANQMQFLNNVFPNYIQYLHELDDLRTQLSFTQATAEASAAQCY